MTFYDAFPSPSGLGSPQGQVSSPQAVVGRQSATAWGSRRPGHFDSHWKAIAIATALAALVAGAEFFVTYCGFSNHCSVITQIAVWPWHAAQFGQASWPVVRF